VTGEQVLLRPRAPGSVDVSPPQTAQRRFHRSIDGYEPTPLRRAPRTAETLGVGEVLVKDESTRLGLPAFKILGASWAVHRALVARAGEDLDSVPTYDALVGLTERLRPLTLSAATDGNHGRGVAHMARRLGLAARIYVPEGTAKARIDAIASEGASVTVVDGGYDDAIRRSAEDSGERCLVISDTSWPGYEDVPRWVVDGYETIFTEIGDALVEHGLPHPNVVALPMGVGALAAAGVRHYWSADGPRPQLIGVEPVSAACVLRSVEAGEIVTLDEPQTSMMAGLNCATPSLIAWPMVSRGVDAYVSVADDRVPTAMRLLAADGVVAGETGAAGLAGLLRLAEETERPWDAGACVLLVATEGATDPENYARIVDGAPDAR
jgi:diaminopropionate ammonia-lyase